MSLFKERSVNAKKLVQLQNKINQLTKELKTAISSQPSNANQAEELQQRLDNMQATIDDLNQANRKLEETLANSESTAKQLKTENRGLKTSLTRLKKKLSSEED